ncbi:PIN domain-containing protein [Candidatus Woesearchaeota archaeon]|nr:PIN domain-containing protein [Candidatus Woesearchaeota archaeon]
MLCLDTSVLVEIARANPKFVQLIKEASVIPDPILAEFYGIVLREWDVQTAEYWFNKMGPFALQVTKEILKEAVKFRHDNKAKNLSFFDAVGYVYAVKSGHEFLTCDQDLEGLPGVRFVKK